MSVEDLNREEEDESKLLDGSESEDELEKLFEEESHEEDESLEDKVARMEREQANVKKGLAKFFSEKGRKKDTQEEKKEESKAEAQTSGNEDVTELFFSTTPKAELVAEQLKDVADKFYNGSILKAWKNESFLREKAQKLSDEKAEDDANKDRIARPSSTGAGGKSKIPFAQIDLNNKDHVALLRSDPKYRDGYNAYLLEKK